jgi:serine/threonine protein kinase/CheY-like chemotaxis protein/TolB-like protein/Tfp pilus assembly protein PilF
MIEEDLSDSRILIVDDVKANVDILVRALGEDYKLSVAMNGETALKIAQKNPPDLVLLDILMPGMDGYEVCRRLRATTPTEDVPVMFLSGLEEVANKALGFEVGGNDYLTKPFEVLEVKARVRSLLRTHAKKSTAIPGNTRLDLTPVKPSDWVGKPLGKYKITEVLGQGAMGVVLKGHDPIIDRDVAIKVLADHLAADETARSRFIAEAQAAGKLNHPNVIAIHEICQEGQAYYLVMEYAAGGSLDDRLAGLQSIGVLEATQALADACEGVGAAHAAGLIHRDIKPANFMRAADGTIKVADFGLAKATVDADRHLTQTGTVIGTPFFMSPEQCQALPLDHRSDIYSLGATYYRMLTGNHPYEEADSVTQLMYLQCHGPIPDARSTNPALPAACARIITRAMAKAPGQRYQSTAEMLADLEAVYAGLSAQTRIKLPSQSALIPATRTWFTPVISGGRRIGWGAASVLFLLLLSGLILGFWRPWQRPVADASAAGAVAPGGEPTKAGDNLPVIAVLPFVNAGDQAAEYLRDGIPGAVLKKLSEIAHLAVRPYSPDRTKDEKFDMHEIGRQLEAQAVLTGRVRQDGDRLSLHVELVNVRDNRIMWVEQYDRRPADLQDIETEIAERICARLGVPLSEKEERRLSRRDTSDPQAHELYLQGRYHMLQSTLEGMNKSLTSFKQAIARDPEYALAYAGLADAYGYYAGDWLPYQEALPQQRVAARKALELDDEIAEAHLAMGNLYMGQDFDWPAAEKELRRAIELKPKLDLAHDAYAQFLAFQGRFDESVAQQKEAMEINPFSPYLIANMSYLCYLQRSYDQALEYARKAMDIDPTYVPAHDYLGLAYLCRGQFTEALGQIRKCRELDDVPWYLARLGAAEAIGGNKAQAQTALKELQELSKGRQVTPECYFLVYVALGDKEQAFAWLQTMYAVRSGYPLRLKVDPALDNLRADQRFTEWLRRLKLVM